MPRSGADVIEVCFGTVEVLSGQLPPVFELPDGAEFFDLGV